MTITTQRLVLGPFAAGDEALLVELDSDPAVMHFVTGGVPEFDPADMPAFLGGGFWGAWLRADRTFVGWFHLRPKDHGEFELGYRLRRSAWGQGLATEGSAALLAEAFDRLGAQRVVAETLAIHAASRRVMEKLGMGLVRHFHADWPYRIPGDEHGDVEYEITRERWPGGRS